MIKLLVRQPDQPDLEVRVDGDVATVGRASGCDVVVNQPYVSKRHLKVFHGFVVVDLGSSNGTFVDGARVSEPTLLRGTEVRLGEGEVTLSLSRDEDARARTTAGAGETELDALRRRCTTLEGELARARAELAELRRETTSVHAPAKPVPAVPIAAQAPRGIGKLLADLAAHDVERVAPLQSGEPEEFVVVEQFRIVRQVERIVTRMAGDFLQHYQSQTMLPDVDGNLRALVGQVLESGDHEARQALLEYLNEMSRWLVIALGAHRRAASRFAESIKQDLAGGALVGDAPIPTFKRISGQADAELWRRANAYLRDLTPDIVEARLEELTRAAAMELLGQRGDSGPRPG